MDCLLCNTALSTTNPNRDEAASEMIALLAIVEILGVRRLLVVRKAKKPASSVEDLGFTIEQRSFCSECSGVGLFSLPDLIHNVQVAKSKINRHIFHGLLKLTEPFLGLRELSFESCQQQWDPMQSIAFSLRWFPNHPMLAPS